MTVITRHDQVPFVVNVYRERVTTSKKNPLTDLLHELADLHGEFIGCVAAQPQTFEVALSHQAGYLLAETVQHYFQAHQNLIFCEWVPSLSTLVVIVLLAGRIYLDRTLTPESLTTELLPLQLLATDFQLVVAGEGINLASPPAWAHPFSSLCSSQEFLPASVIERLPVVASAKLLPFLELQKALVWRTHRRLLLSTLAIGILMLGIGVFSYQEHVRSQATPTLASTDTGPLLAYRNATVHQPSAASILQTTATFMRQLQALPGWSVLSLQIQPPHIIARLQPTQGSPNTLQTFAQQLGAHVTWSADGVSLTYDLLPASTTPWPVLVPLAITQPLLQQAVARHTLDSNLQLHGTQTYADCQATRMTLTLHDLYLAELLSLGTAFNHQPVVLEQMTMTVHEWQLHAVIKLTVWGTRA